jgi:DNA-binding NtrC family response regulator
VEGTILIAEDDAGVRYTLCGVLEDAGFLVEGVADGAEALARLDEGRYPVVLSDLRMPKLDGLSLLRNLAARPRRPKLILITAHGSERHAVEAMKAGAYDYLKKPFENEELLAVVRRALGASGLEAENERLAGELNLSRSLLFASEAMSRLAVLVGRVAPRDVTVLITGESGTGKELVAEALVRASGRAGRPFVRFNCAALPAELAEAELFGHAKGAFTGAHKARPGLFREADSGTLLLDEIGELSLPTQAKLLRVLQEGEIRPVGEERPIKIDVRILAATHRDLPAEIAQKSFREDLYYRLKVVSLHLPPLRERPADIPVLAEYFLARFSRRFGLGPLRAGPELLARLSSYPWPGNVRELENALEGLVVLSPDGELDLSLLPGRPGAELGLRLSLRQRVDAYERGLLVEALSAAKGNRSEAARALQTSRATLYEKLHKHALASPEDLPAEEPGE